MKLFSTVKHKKGYVALIMVLILSAVSLIIATSFTELSVGEGQASRSQTVGEDTLAITESCAEEGLWRVQQSASYTGSQSFTIADSSGIYTCTLSIAYIPIPLFGASTGYYVLVATPSGTPELGSTRSIEVAFTRDTQISIWNWLEL